MRSLISLIALVACALIAPPARGTTSITFTRAEIDQMANLFETDCLAVSPLANTQYPAYTTNWQFIFPHTNISSDDDIHIDMAVDAAGSGKSGNNTGASPIVTEVINATPSQLNALGTRNARQAIFRGIFRFYSEHPGERHFEIHPVTQLLTYNGATFAADLDYHGNIVWDPNGTTHPNSTLVAVFDGTLKVNATASANNSSLAFTFPSPSVNYVQYDGVALSGVQSDALSQYFLFRPNLVPSATVRCRLVANTGAAATVAGLVATQTLTVNALTRTDMATVSAQVATLTANQSMMFPRPIELITLGVPTLGPAPTPTPTPTPTPAGPVVVSNAATAVTSNTATLNGTVNPRGQPAMYQFQLGTDTSYPFTQFAQNAGNGNVAAPVTVTLAGLQPATTYHFRLVAWNAGGSTNGNDLSFTTASATDTDNDGMPNDYETANGFNPNGNFDAALDADGDGMTNLSEYRAGTNPRSAASVLRITSIQRGGEDLVINFPSVFGKMYRLESADSPDAVVWDTLQDNSAGTGAPITISDTEATDLHPHRYYRVRALP